MGRCDRTIRQPGWAVEQPNHTNMRKDNTHEQTPHLFLPSGEVVYYKDGVRVIFWPRTSDINQMNKKLQQARQAGIEGVRVVWY